MGTFNEWLKEMTDTSDGYLFTLNQIGSSISRYGPPPGSPAFQDGQTAIQDIVQYLGELKKKRIQLAARNSSGL